MVTYLVLLCSDHLESEFPEDLFSILKLIGTRQFVEDDLPLFCEKRFCPFEDLRKIGGCSRDDEVKLPLVIREFRYFFGTRLDGTDPGKTESLDEVVHGTDLFTDRIHEREICLGKEDLQRNPRESSPTSDIEHFS